MNLNLQATKNNTYDAIVVGSGMSGGWAAKELCEKGLKTLVLERGRDVRHVTDYTTAMKNPWEFEHRNKLPLDFKVQNPIAARCYAVDEATEQFFVKDNHHPYVQEKPYDWIRGYQTGGKSLLWARQVQRWSEYEFDAPARDGFGVEWPIGYDDLAPWYSYVERFAGISGNKDGLKNLPDGEFQKPFELNAVEKHIQAAVHKDYKNRQVIIGRCAHLTEPQPWHLELGRGQCQARHLCYRGCPYGAYFSSNSATLPAAARTGNLTLRPHSVVHSVIYDPQKGKATGVRVTDANTNETTDYFAKVIFMNAACLNTNLVLMNSTSGRFPDGLGNDNGLLGRYVAFHNYRGSLTATFEGYQDSYYFGRRPTTAFMPSFRNVEKQDSDFMRGYMVAFSASRRDFHRGARQDGFGAAFKESLTRPGDWSVYMMMQGETIPKYENHLRLSPTLKDAWGIPQLVTSIGYDDNDQKLFDDFIASGTEMLTKSGCSGVVAHDSKQSPGLDIHEMGGCRMGKDPKTSLLNGWNQFHACANVFVTDGACMPSVGNQNPSLTFMALTARAANHAVEELKKGNL